MVPLTSKKQVSGSSFPSIFHGGRQQRLGCPIGPIQTRPVLFVKSAVHWISRGLSEQRLSNELKIPTDHREVEGEMNFPGKFLWIGLSPPTNGLCQLGASKKPLVS